MSPNWKASEGFTLLRRKFEQSTHHPDGDSQPYLHMLADGGERAITARDLLFKENHDLLKQNNQSNTWTSRKSTMANMVRKEKS